MLGENVARLRRERGLTQEQLGRLLNVSGQAVSKWENGGAPDAEMLPALADRLGVTIDALFGRGNEPSEDAAEVLLRRLASFPSEQRMTALFRLLCATFQRPYYTDSEGLGEAVGALLRLPLASCYSTELRNGREEQLWLRSVIYLEEGLQLGVLAEDCPLFLLLPEPKEGYARHLARDDDYRRLFSALQTPHALTLLRCLMQRKDSYYTVPSIARLSGVAAAEARPALKALAGCGLLRETAVEDETGPTPVYQLHDTGALMPFLLFARWLCEENDVFLINWNHRERPILQAKEEKNG